MQARGRTRSINTARTGSRAGTGGTAALVSERPDKAARTARLRQHALSLLAGLCFVAAAQGAHGQIHALDTRNFVVPQHRTLVATPGVTVQVTGVKAGVVIRGQTASTTLDVELHNPGSRSLEAELLLPVPAGAVIRGFAFEGAAREPTARLLRRDEARRTYESIVARLRDPALIEFAGHDLVRSSVFPVPPGGRQKLRLTYDQLLERDGSRVDYVLPRSESNDYSVPWTVSVRIHAERPVATVYSPSHEVEVEHKAPREVVVRLRADARREPGPFRLSYLLQGQGGSASFFAYPDPAAGGGLFLLMAGVPRGAAQAPPVKREITLVLDRSGSMNGRKLEQARRAALQVLDGLGPGESFNLITYNEAVDVFSARAVAKNVRNASDGRRYLERMLPRGGTNIHDALLAALHRRPAPGTLPLVFFLTDGRPTIGRTSERAIRALARDGNLHGRRVFTFGVGTDVNTPLLERIASLTRGTAAFVLPGQDVETEVAKVFRRLRGPRLAGPRLSMLDTDNSSADRRVHDLTPDPLPDLFEGDQLIVLGRYTGDAPLHFTLEGRSSAGHASFRFDFDPHTASARAAFVPRLWASRRIGMLEDAVRDLGDGELGVPVAHTATRNPRFRELVDEIVRLSLEHGVLSEYTAFLAREGTDLSVKDQVLAEAYGNFSRRALDTRSGLGSINQDVNRQHRKQQKVLNRRNTYWDASMKATTVTRAQQVADKVLHRRGNVWLDGKLAERGVHARPGRTVRFGSDEYWTLVRHMVREGRQGLLSFRGDVLVELHGETVLIQGPAGS